MMSNIYKYQHTLMNKSKQANLNKQRVTGRKHASVSTRWRKRATNPNLALTFSACAAPFFVVTVQIYPGIRTARMCREPGCIRTCLNKEQKQRAENTARLSLKSKGICFQSG